MHEAYPAEPALPVSRAGPMCVPPDRRESLRGFAVWLSAIGAARETPKRRRGTRGDTGSFRRLSNPVISQLCYDARVCEGLGHDAEVLPRLPLRPVPAGPLQVARAGGAGDVLRRDDRLLVLPPGPA